MMHAEELSRLFAAERAVRPPPGALEQGLASWLPAVAAGAAPLPVASGALKLTWTTVSKWILAGFVVGVAGSGAAARVWAPAATRAAPASSHVARVAAPAVVAATATLADVPNSDVAVSEVAASAPLQLAPRASARSPAEAAPSAEPTRFDAELRLITLAKAELDAGRPHLAQAWLAEHAARFPQGVFATDRQALSVLIGCSARRDAAAARVFAVQHPSSPMLERLRRACGADEKPNSVNEKPTGAEPTLEEGGKR